jgi:predicted metal-dependent HD superfamily phosphohydrolase
MENMKVILISNIEKLQPYFRDPHNIKLYALSTGVIYDSQADDVYNALYNDFMANETARVEYLLS